MAMFRLQADEQDVVTHHIPFGSGGTTTLHMFWVSCMPHLMWLKSWVYAQYL